VWDFVTVRRWGHYYQLHGFGKQCVASNASYGGGIALEQNDTATVITGTNISMNTSTSFGANAWGGGLYFHTEDGTISSGTIKENRANANAPAGPESNGYAGGIVARLSSHITINNESMIVQIWHHSKEEEY